jgi:hypothetical protein
MVNVTLYITLPKYKELKEKAKFADKSFSAFLVDCALEWNSYNQPVTVDNLFKRRKK